MRILELIEFKLVSCGPLVYGIQATVHSLIGQTGQTMDEQAMSITVPTIEADRIVSGATTESVAIRADTAEKIKEEQASWSEEKKCTANTHVFDPVIDLNVGGHRFTTTITTLTMCPDTMLGAMFSGRHALVKDGNGAYFIDRDGTHFREILNFLRAPDAYRSDNMSARVKTEVETEADFYGLKDLMFPPPAPIPPFVPADPVRVQVRSGSWAMVSQNDLGLWYIEHPECGRSLVKVCRYCGWGQPCTSKFPEYGVPKFTTDRVITDLQPRKTEICLNDESEEVCSCE